MTVIASSCFSSPTATARARLMAWVVAGNCKSLVRTKIRSSSAIFFLPTSLSEQTAKLISGISLSCVHSRKVWLSSDRLGTRNNTRCPFPANASAIRNAVKVLPVPQAIIILPRAAPLAKPAFTLFSASFWCLRRDFFSFRTGVGLIWNCDQSMTLLSKSCRVMRATGGCWSSRALSAFLDHLSVVVIIRR